MSIPCRQLMRNGVWLVPPSERPTGWEKMPVREPIRLIVTGEELPDILRCACGLPASHVEECLFRSARERVAWSDAVRYFKTELIPEIHKSAVAFGAERSLEMAARVLMAGMWTREALKLKEMTEVPMPLIEQVAQRCRKQNLWTDEGVHLGELDEASGDMELWLNAMCAHGDIQYCGDEKYASLDWQEPKKNR